jgi:hypothetical protein
MGKLRLEAELRKFTKEMSSVAPNMDAVNRVEVSASDFATLEREMYGRTGTSAEVAVINPVNEVRVIAQKSTTVLPGTVEFWTKYEV